MMKALILVALFALAGCTTTPPEVRVIESEKMVLLEPDQQYLVDCQSSEPPYVSDYKNMGKDEREDALVRSLTAAYEHRQKCTVEKKSLRDLVAKQKAIVAEYNLKEEARVKALKTQLEKK